MKRTWQYSVDHRINPGIENPLLGIQRGWRSLRLAARDQVQWCRGAGCVWSQAWGGGSQTLSDVSPGIVPQNPSLLRYWDQDRSWQEGDRQKILHVSLYSAKKWIWDNFKTVLISTTYRSSDMMRPSSSRQRQLLLNTIVNLLWKVWKAFLTLNLWTYFSLDIKSMQFLPSKVLHSILKYLQALSKMVLQSG